MPITDEDLVRRRLDLRAYVDGEDAKHVEAMKPWKAQIELIEGEMLRRLNDRGANNSSTPAGVFYKESGTAYKVTDKVAFLDFVYSLRNSASPLAALAYDMLTQAVARDSMGEYSKATNGQSPPGIEATGYIKVKVRKG